MSLVDVTDWPCPMTWCGMTTALEDGRVVFACAACADPGGCADARSCERNEALPADRRAPDALTPEEESGSVGTTSEERP